MLKQKHCSWFQYKRSNECDKFFKKNSAPGTDDTTEES